MMEVTIQVPEDIAARWQACGDIPRDVLEGAALEAYRKRIIGESRLQQWLGFETRFEVHAFLKSMASRSTTAWRIWNDRQAHDRLGI